MDRDPVVELPFLARYRNRFDATWTDEEEIDRVRFVSLDTETTGLNPHTDPIVTIGAVAVQNGEILLGDSFEALLKITRNTDAVTVHGVTRDESLAGIDEPAALESFLDYLKDGVIVGHHIGHDISALNAALVRHWGIQMSNRTLDTMNLTLLMERDGAFSGRPRIRRYTLDALCEMFGVIPYGRHTAPGDAVITAEVFLHLRRLALKHGRGRLGPICETFHEEETE